jgi:hypothetical protein
MATVPVFDVGAAFVRSLASALAVVESVRSAHVYQSERAMVVWIDIAQDDEPTRRAVYEIEDRLSDKFGGILIDFHLIPVPTGRKIEDFVTAECVYQRRLA